MDPRIDSVSKRIASHRGGEFAKQLVDKVLHSAGVGSKEKYTAQELYTIAGKLISEGGLVEMVGRSLKVQALTLGAVAPPEDVKASMERLNRK